MQQRTYMYMYILMSCGAHLHSDIYMYMFICIHHIPVYTVNVGHQPIHLLEFLYFALLSVVYVQKGSLQTKQMYTYIIPIYMYMYKHVY